MPPFENVVAQQLVTVTPEEMTCGLRSRTDFCVQTNGVYRECDFCQEDMADKRHPPSFLTDIHEDFNQTWWQSVTMLEDVHTRDVNLTINLGEASNSMISTVIILSKCVSLDLQARLTTSRTCV